MMGFILTDEDYLPMTVSTIIDQNTHLTTITMRVGDQIMTVMFVITAFKERSKFNFLRKQ